MDDEQIAQLASLPEMEFRTAVVGLILSLRRQTDDQTEIIAETQAILNRDVLVKVAEMYDILETAKSFFAVLGRLGRFLARIGAGVMWALEGLGKIAKPALWVLAFCAAAWAWWKTGTFTLPNWSALK